MTETITPLEYNCVVELEPVEKKTASGLYLPDERAERDQMAHTVARLVKAGAKAFTDEHAAGSGRKWDDAPKEGDRVMIRKYAGQIRTADPTDRIRIVADKEIVAVLG